MYSLFTDEANLIFGRDGCYDGGRGHRGVRGSFRRKWFSPTTLGLCINHCLFHFIRVHLVLLYFTPASKHYCTKTDTTHTIRLTCPPKQYMDYDRVFNCGILDRRDKRSYTYSFNVKGVCLFPSSTCCICIPFVSIPDRTSEARHSSRFLESW